MGSRRMGEHGRVGCEIMDSNGVKQIYLGGRIDVDVLVGIERQGDMLEIGVRLVEKWGTWESDNDRTIGFKREEWRVGHEK